jgi:glycosyltransferase involved in cell wall biosynthesis
METKPNLRILEIGRDPWIGPSYPGDFLPLGRSIAPGKFGHKPNLKGFTKVAWRILRREYDVIALGPLQVDRTSGLSWRGRLVKRLISRVSASPALSWIMRRLLCGPRSSVAILDVSYNVNLSKAALKIFRPVIYFKRNLLKSDREAGEWNLHVFPMAVEPHRVLSTTKTTDLFVCGAYTNDARKAALEAARVLQQLGWRVDIEEQNIGYEEYQERLAAARMVICFHGYGFHTWRMYEAALARAVPVIDPPPDNLIHDFMDGENCVVVQPSIAAIVKKLDQSLKNPQLIEFIAGRAFQDAQQKHTLTACSSMLVSEIEKATRASPVELCPVARRVANS